MGGGQPPARDAARCSDPAQALRARQMAPRRRIETARSRPPAKACRSIAREVPLPADAPRAFRPAGISCIMRPRSATSASASSREKTPARHAATNSPTLWPSMACGRMPQLIHSCARAYSTVKIAGWATIGIGNAALVFLGSAFGWIQQRAKIGVQKRPQNFRATVHRGSKDRLAVVNLPAHIQVLRALARETGSRWSCFRL